MQNVSTSRNHFEDSNAINMKNLQTPDPTISTVSVMNVHYCQIFKKCGLLKRTIQLFSLGGTSLSGGRVMGQWFSVQRNLKV